MSSFNAFTQKKRTGYNGGVPVWLGIVSPRPVGGTLATAFCKEGILIPAGAPVYFDEANKTVTPFLAWEVVSVDSSTHAITVKANDYAILPAANDFLGIVGTTFAATGAAGKASSVAAGATDGQYVITMTDGKLDGATAGSFLAASAATAVASSGASLANQPNAYLYNDVCIENLLPGESYDSKKASCAVVDFHGEGILINRTASAPFKSQMKSAVPAVIQIGY